MSRSVSSRALFALSLLCLFSFRASAGVLIVNQKHPKAADTNPGTDQLPFLTISAAASKVKPGDRVIIHAGNYRETVIITASGISDQPITFEAAPNETPVIKGSDLLDGWSKEARAIWKVKLPGLPARESDGKSPNYWITNDVRQVFVKDGAMLDAQGLRRVTDAKAMKAGTFYCDVASSTLYVWLLDDASPIEHPVEVSRRGAWLALHGEYVIIRGLAMRHASSTAFAAWPACLVYGSNNEIDRCTISWGDFAGISLSGNKNRLTRSLIACNGGCGIGGSGREHVIEKCRVVFNNLDRYNPDWHAGGAKLIPNFRDSLIRQNEFAHNLGPGLWLDNQCDQNVIDSNFAHDNEGPGIMVEVSANNLVVNNVSSGNRNFLSGTYRNEGSKAELILHSEQRVSPSRLFRPYHAGDGRGIYISSAPGTKVLNNTSYRNEGEGICVEGPPRGDMSTVSYTVMNNICVFNQGAQLSLRPDRPGADSPSRSDYNLIFSVGAILARNGWDGATAFDLKKWQELTNRDTHSLDADPQFIMAAMDDFRPSMTSPALRAGVALPECDHDFLGRARGKETTSLGAFEGPAENHPARVADMLDLE